MYKTSPDMLSLSLSLTPSLSFLQPNDFYDSPGKESLRFSPALSFKYCIKLSVKNGTLFCPTMGNDYLCIAEILCSAGANGKTG